MSLKTLDSMCGNEAVIAQLARAAKEKKPNHAYLLSGEKGSGKRHLAEAFATALLCKEGDGEACGQCVSCRKAAAGNHPDIIHLRHEKAELITVDEVREQLVASAPIKPNESDYKVYIVPDAECMNVQAQNALLKTIEEPPAFVVILLLTTNPEAMLATIRSRCVSLHLSSLPESTVSDYLTERFALAKEEADAAAAIAQGNIGRAKEIADGGQMGYEIGEILQLMRQLPGADVVKIGELVDEWKKDKGKLRDRFALLTLWFRDVLLFKATKDADSVCFKKEVGLLREQARHCSYEGVDAMLEAVSTASRRMGANANEDLTLELMFLTMVDHLG